MLGRQHRAAARERAEQQARAQAEADADRLDDLAGPDGHRHEITAGRAERIRARPGADLVTGDSDQLAAVPRLQGVELDAETDRLGEQYPELGEAADYYRPAYGRYEPDWIPPPDDVSPTAWDRYLTSRPGSDEHKAAYVDMHQEAEGKGFPGPDPDKSYLADHGFEADAGRWLTREEIENGAEPDDAYRPDEPGLDAASWGPELDAPDHLYGASECAEADPETAHFGERSPEAEDRGHWPLPRVLNPGQASPALTPVAAALADATPHADPFHAERGWPAQGDVFVGQPQAQAEAG